MSANVVTLPTIDESTPFSKYNTPNSKIMFPVVERQVHWMTKHGQHIEAPGHKAIVRVHPSDNNTSHLLNIVGRGYQLVHNRELMASVESAMMDNIEPDMLKDVRVTDRVAGFGKLCFREYVFPNIRCALQRSTRSDIAFRAIVQNGYGGSALRIHAGAIDFFCTNGMVSGEFNAAYHRHTSGLVVENLSNTITKALETFASEQVKWKRWADTPVKHEAAMELLKSIATSPRLYENLSNQYMHEMDTRGPNLWSVYSALTYYASHNEGEFALRKPAEAANTEAQIMMQREMNVAKWIRTPAWRNLENAQQVT